MSSYIIGIDISQTSTGLARFCAPSRDGGESEVTWLNITAPRGKGFYDEQERAAKMLTGITHWIGNAGSGVPDRPALAVLEDFAFGVQMAGTRSVAMVTGVIRYWLWKQKIPFVLVSPMGLKKFCVGRASKKGDKIGKEIVNRELFARFGHKVDQNDAADAVVLTYIGAALKGLWTPQIEAQREVLSKLRLEK